MSNTNDFTEYYKTISDAELLNILLHPGNYQPAANEAAKAEFSARQLSDADIEKAKQQLAAEEELKEQEKEKRKAFENTIMERGNRFIDVVNPVRKDIVTTGKTINYIVAVWSFFLLYYFVTHYFDLFYAIKDFADYPFETFFLLLPLCIAIIAVFNFWLRKRSGWVLLLAYQIFLGSYYIGSIVNNILWKLSFTEWKGSLFYSPSNMRSFLALVFYTAMVYVLCRKDVREVYAADKQLVIATFLVAGLISVVWVYAIS